MQLLSFVFGCIPLLFSMVLKTWVLKPGFLKTWRANLGFEDLSF